MRAPEDLAAKVRIALADVATDRSVVTLRQAWRALGRSGVIESVYLDRPNGPGGWAPDLQALSTVIEEADARLPTGVVLGLCVQLATVIPLMSESAPSPGPAETLTRLLAGEIVVALAVTDEAAGGSELMDLATCLVAKEGALTVAGGKRWITAATVADLLLVLARDREARHFTSFRWVLVSVGQPGVRVTPAGLNVLAGAGLGHIDLDQVDVTAAGLVGQRGRGLVSFARQVGFERFAGGVWAQAMCRRVLSGLRESLAERSLDGRPMWEHPAIRQRFAWCLVELSQIVAICESTARALAVPGAAVESMVLKAAIARGVDRILGECVQLRGADAFRDNGEAQLRAEAELFGVAGGATGAMLAGIADHADVLLATW